MEKQNKGMRSGACWMTLMNQHFTVVVRKFDKEDALHVQQFL